MNPEIHECRTKGLRYSYRQEKTLYLPLGSAVEAFFRISIRKYNYINYVIKLN
jgi:hypothetical protein